jgi:Nif11 domain
MAQADFEQFKQLVLQDFSLQEQLRLFTERDEFIMQVIEISGKYGFQITIEDIEEVWQTNSRLLIERWI